MKHRILVASDNPGFLRTCQLIGDDFEVVTAGSGEQGLLALKKHGPWHAVLSDIRLPDMEGAKFLTRSSMNTVASTSSILLAERRDLEPGIKLVNSKNFFTLLPLPCTPETLDTVLRDAVRHAVMIEQKRRLQDTVKTLAITDPLTRCYTRSYLLERLPKELLRAQRYQHDLSIILCDIDQLNIINDQHGYRIGNSILSEYAAMMQKMIRNDLDWVTRWGGDELLIVLPETPLNGAKIVAQRMLDLISSMEIQTETGTVQVSASYGVADLTSDARRMNELLAKAEFCLQKAQAAGGNHVYSSDFRQNDFRHHSYEYANMSVAGY